MLQALFGTLRSVKFTEFKPTDNCDKEGPLLKRGGAPLHRWKEKWFVLQNEALFEFANQKSRSVYSKFVLQDALIEPLEIKKKQFAFTIKLQPSNNVLTLCAPSESEMIDWMNKLFKASCFKLAKNEVPPRPNKPLPVAPSDKNIAEAERLKKQLMIKRVTSIQALWRGRQCRKVYPQIVKMNKQRLNIVNELLETERSYLSYLAIIIELYQKPMEEKATGHKPIISTEDINKIFSDIEIIYSIHRMLRRELEERIQNWFPQQKLAPVFNMLCSSMKSYAQYVNNYDTAVKVLESCKAKSAFAAFLEKLNQNTGLTMDLFALLIMPVQRPPRLCMLLRDLLNKTWKGHEDENDLREAVGQMEAVTAYLNESKREAENRSKVFAIQQHLQETGRDTILELLQPHRRYICEGSLIQIGENGHKKKERYVFLFNDMMLISRKVAITKGLTSRVKSIRYKVDHSKQAVAMLSHFTDVQNLDDLKDLKHVFGMRSPTDLLIFSADNAEHKQGWMQNIELALRELQKQTKSKSTLLTTTPISTTAATQPTPSAATKKK